MAHHPLHRPRGRRQINAASDIIAAVATPPGAGGIGIVRISGGDVSVVANAILFSGKLPPPRTAVREKFVAANGAILDDGICLYFRAPHSFTGQDVLELHAHGGGASLRAILERCFCLGARAADAGEFTMRAYCNGKIDLAQAEAIADLINAQSESAARAAANSLDGAFSRRVAELENTLRQLRAELEAALDFADEETGASSDFAKRIARLSDDVRTFLSQCKHGAKLAEGITVAIVGAPNAGKSSLLNALCGEDAAIVAAAAGTTRDVIARDIAFGGIPARIWDTAGLREDAGEIEQEGIARAVRAMQNADIVLAVRDGNTAPEIQTSAKVFDIRNKIDLSPNVAAGVRDDAIYISAKTGAGISDLRAAITAFASGEKSASGEKDSGGGKDSGTAKDANGTQDSVSEKNVRGKKSASSEKDSDGAKDVRGEKDSGSAKGVGGGKNLRGVKDSGGEIVAAFTARARHLAALNETLRCLAEAENCGTQAEIAAAWLSSAHDQIASLTGGTDDEKLLGEIFSKFCIGK